MKSENPGRVLSSRRRFCEWTASGTVAGLMACAKASGDESTGTGAGMMGSTSSGSSTGSIATTTTTTTTGQGTTTVSTSSTGEASDVSSSGASTTTQTGGSSGAGSDATGTSDTGDTTGTESTGTTGSEECVETVSVTEGPFYREGVPIRSNLDIYGDEGTPFHLTGRVVDAHCQPIANAVVEIWHATPLAPGGEVGEVEALYDETQEFRYYGQTATDGAGSYALSSLRPGWYRIAGGYRATHLHIKVWVGNEAVLTTQLYFEGDPINESDFLFEEANLLFPDAMGRAIFDLVLMPGISN